VNGKPGAPFQPSAKPYYKLYLSMAYVTFINITFINFMALFIMGVGRRHMEVCFGHGDHAHTYIVWFAY
jgi:hypothetical protein